MRYTKRQYQPSRLEGVQHHAARIIANDDASKADLGRTLFDQQVIHMAMPYLRNEINLSNQTAETEL